jgi:hypothetical protein
MSELIIFSIPFLTGLGIGILIGMGLQVRSEVRWIKKIESGRSVEKSSKASEDVSNRFGESSPRVRNGSPKTDRPDSYPSSLSGPELS